MSITLYELFDGNICQVIAVIVLAAILGVVIGNAMGREDDGR